VVYLVGAGPGDPGLLTLKGARLLALAEVVVYDYLANPLLLSHCPKAEKIYVGKKAAAHSFTQESINSLLVELGLKGKRVVRLKGGDPFIFGRGGEECEALKGAGVRFEVVPGITAAVAGPAYAGIPVTHRDFNSSFTFVTGHEKEESSGFRGQGSASEIDWGTLAKLPALGFYMGVKSLSGICEKLIENGMDASMPAATIRWGTRPEQETVVGTLGDLAEKVAAAGLRPPAITIVGKVVSLRPTLDWFESRPMFGQTVVVTRTRSQASELTAELLELGANVLEAPTIEIHPSGDGAGIEKALKNVGTYDWVIFTSQNGVVAAKERLIALGLDARAFGTAKIAAIGDVTAEAIGRELCLRVDLCPKEFVAEALAAELIGRGEVEGKRFLLLRADIARPMLRERLQEKGAAEVNDVAIYETRGAESLPVEVVEAIEEKRVEWVTFTSSSTAKNLAALLGPTYREKLAGVKIASIGPITTKTLVELGLTPTVEAVEFNLRGLVAAMRGMK
jgi:uroporphyrinogen III methyltransferase/synthase